MLDERIPAARDALRGPQLAPRRFQFHLGELFILVTVSAIVFAVLRRFGARGFNEQVAIAVFVGAVAASIWGIHCRIKHNLGL